MTEPPRPKSQTIGMLGRAPARVSVAPPAFEPPAGEPPPHDDNSPRRWLRGALFDNVALKFLSMVLAITVFLLVNTDRDSEAIASVGLSYTLPADMELAPNQIAELNVKVRGSERQLRKLGALEPIHLDLRDNPTGEVTITADMIHVKPGLTIESVTPGTLHVAFDRRRDEYVDVSPRIVGQAKHGYVFAEAIASPAKVAIRGGESLIRAQTAIRTFEIDLEGHDESFTTSVPLAPPDGVTIVRSGPVTVQVKIVEELVTRTLDSRAVAIRGGDPTRWAVSPATVDITLTGTLLGVEKARDNLMAVVNLGKDDVKPAARDGEAKPREAEVVLDGLPPGIGAKISPERVKLTPTKP